VGVSTIKLPYILEKGGLTSWVAGNTSYQVSRRKEYGPRATTTRVRTISPAKNWTAQPVNQELRKKHRNLLVGVSTVELSYILEKGGLSSWVAGNTSYQVNWRKEYRHCAITTWVRMISLAKHWTTQPVNQDPRWGALMTSFFDVFLSNCQTPREILVYGLSSLMLCGRYRSHLSHRSTRPVLLAPVNLVRGLSGYRGTQSAFLQGVAEFDSSDAHQQVSTFSTAHRSPGA
jgi:hypothetical protein